MMNRDERRKVYITIVLSMILGLVCFALAGLFFNAAFAQETEPHPVASEARAVLQNQGGEAVGEALFSSSNRSLSINVSLSGLTPGKHGIHIHERGECKEGYDPTEDSVVPVDTLTLSTRNHAHPDESSPTAHSGDLPMVTVAEDGTGTLQYTTSDLTLSDDPTSVLNRTIVIHANSDDYETDPAGNSGERLVCGVILATPTVVQERFIVPGGATYPEGIALAPDASAVFTGSSNDGTIYKVPLDGSETQIFSLGGSPGRTAALGMKVAANGKLLVAGGASGMVAILDTTTGMTLKVLRTLEAPPSYLNDLTVTSDGTVYVTDSFRPMLYRFNVNDTGSILEPWLDLSTTPIEYQPGQINLNGIVSSPDGEYLVTVQLATGQLWHIDTATQAVTPVQLEQPLTGGAGLVLTGNTLYVIQNSLKQISILELSKDYTRRP
jgi:superoxide dismutase, Cu-Zn family